MKKHLVSTILFTLFITMPGYADCPFRHTSKSVQTDKPAKTPVVQTHSYATPESTVFWHDLHWFE